MTMYERVCDGALGVFFSTQCSKDMAAWEAPGPGSVWSGLPVLRRGYWQRAGGQAGPLRSRESRDQQGEMPTWTPFKAATCKYQPKGGSISPCHALSCLLLGIQNKQYSVLKKQIKLFKPQNRTNLHSVVNKGNFWLIAMQEYTNIDKMLRFKRTFPLFLMTCCHLLLLQL